MTSDKIAIVTGANNGIGFETTIGMAQAGFTTVMACRNGEKAEIARAKILERVPGADLNVMLLDLSDLASVRTFASDFGERYDHLDVLINNAGILANSIKENTAGIEQQFATNHLGHFLLTALLIDMMPDDPSSRVVALSSIAHKGANIHFDDLSCGGAAVAAYGQSKLACLIFAEELNRRLKTAGRKVTALAVHPGGSDSGLFDEMGRMIYLAFKLVSPLITHSNANAAKPTLYAALDPSVSGGDYFGPQGLMEMRGKVGVAKRDPNTQDLNAANRLWTLSEELVGQSFNL
jgi:NAD(P)-dependent dehydrogenase (short-subunit alcohol dehydrogenase family)